MYNLHFNMKSNMWAMISILEYFTRLGFTRTPQSWNCEVERLPKAIVGKHSQAQNISCSVFHAFLQLKKKMLHIQMHMYAFVYIHTYTHTLTFAFIKNENIVQNILQKYRTQSFIWFSTGQFRETFPNMFFQTLFFLFVNRYCVEE